jgi:hypothetical protein
MTYPKPLPAPLCSICQKSVELETSKTDSHGAAVHRMLRTQAFAEEAAEAVQQLEKSNPLQVKLCTFDQSALCRALYGFGGAIRFVRIWT